jgi:aminoglycoside phosphotransferase (APT) family kinase protein
MSGPQRSPSAGALEEVRRLAGPSATIDSVQVLEGGQHAATWRVDTMNPALAVVAREFPAGDPAAGHEMRILKALNGLGGLAPTLLGGDLAGLWSEHPSTLISWLDGEADITPAEPDAWAAQLGRTLATVHAVPVGRVSELARIFDVRGGSYEALEGPLAERVRSRWPEITETPDVLTHSDYWSGNVVWRDGVLSGVVDWSGAYLGPRGYDVGWCRLDLHLLFDQRVADAFLAAYEKAAGSTLTEVGLWDSWALARADGIVETWDENYRPLGRPDLDPDQLRRRHAEWSQRLVEAT